MEIDVDNHITLLVDGIFVSYEIKIDINVIMMDRQPESTRNACDNTQKKHTHASKMITCWNEILNWMEFMSKWQNIWLDSHLFTRSAFKTYRLGRRNDFFLALSLSLGMCFCQRIVIRVTNRKLEERLDYMR